MYNKLNNFKNDQKLEIKCYFMIKTKVSWNEGLNYKRYCRHDSKLYKVFTNKNKIQK